MTGTALVPGRPGTIRFAAGTFAEPRSGVWRLVVGNDDSYLGVSIFMGVFKVSLHRSGIWRSAFTERAWAGKDSNRLHHSWQRGQPNEHGWVDGPVVLIPRLVDHLGRYTNVYERDRPETHWLPPAQEGRVLAAKVFINAVAKDPPGLPPDWTVVEGRTQRNGETLWISWTHVTPDNDYLETCKRFLRENRLSVVGGGPRAGGSLIWVTTTQTPVPTLTDLPAPIDVLEP